VTRGCRSTRQPLYFKFKRSFEQQLRLGVFSSVRSAALFSVPGLIC
jgi:hypothetical protein